VAQFGRGALVDVSSKLLSQFVDQLHDKVLNPTTDSPLAEAAATAEPPAGTAEALAPATPPGEASVVDAPVTPAVRTISHAETEPVDLLNAAGAPLAKRLVPLVAGLIVVLLIVRRLRRRNQSDD
jgi:hypothetical protein